MEALPLMCSKQTSRAERGQLSVCTSYYLYYYYQSSQSPSQSKPMVPNAEFSNANMTHLRHLQKSFLFTAINRSGSSSSESKGDKKKGVLDGKWHLAGPDRLNPQAAQGPHRPLCCWLSGLIFSFGQRDPSQHTGVYWPQQLNMPPREAGRGPGHLREPRRLEMECFSASAQSKSAGGLHF